MKPTYEMLVLALRKVKSNGTRIRYDTRDLIDSLLDHVDDPEETIPLVVARMPVKLTEPKDGIPEDGGVAYHQRMMSAAPPFRTKKK